MEDRWQLFEYLKITKGFVRVEDVKNMNEHELKEGLQEYITYLERNIRCRNW